MRAIRLDGDLFSFMRLGREGEKGMVGAGMNRDDMRWDESESHSDIAGG